MLADAVEAACRTLENPSVPRLEKFIRQLVTAKYEDGQLDKADLTFADLDTIRSSFVNILAGYYHTRIEYPNQKDPDSGEKTAQSEKTAQNEKQSDKSTQNEKSSGKSAQSDKKNEKYAARFG